MVAEQRVVAGGLAAAAEKITPIRHRAAAAGTAEGQVLDEVAVSVEGMQFVVLMRRKPVLEYPAKGFLADALARIVGEVGLARRVAVGLGPSPASRRRGPACLARATGA